MVYSDCKGPSPGTGLGMRLVSMGSNILCRNVHISLRQGKGSGSIVSYYASLRSLYHPLPGRVQCE